MSARLALVLPTASRMANRIVDVKLPRMLAAGWDVHAIVPPALATPHRERIHAGDPRTQLARLKPQLVHFELSAAQAIDVPEARAVATCGGSDLVSRHAPMPGIHALHCFTPGEAREARLHSNHAEVRIIPPIVREIPRAGLPSAATELRILVVAPLHWTQGLEVVMEAMSELVRAGVAAKLRLVGKGDALVPVGFARHQLGLEPYVDMIRQDDGLDLLPWADVMLHLPVADAISPDLLEAQASGIPAVVSDATGLSDVIAHEQTGLVVPRRSPRAAADALARLARDPSLRERLGAEARQRAHSSFAPAAAAAAYDAWYREILRAETRDRESRPRPG